MASSDPSSNTPTPVCRAAEKFWQVRELRQELFQWNFIRAQLAEMMVLEKRSLPEVAKALYRKIDDVNMRGYLKTLGCAEVSWECLR